MPPAKHTPGPWKLDKGRAIVGLAFDGSEKFVVEKVRGGSPEQADANAHLIAAAPDLLDGCNALLGLLTLLDARDDLPGDVRTAIRESHRVHEAKAAIAKAEGR